MTRRASEPSNSRFEVWPAGSDSYNHVDLAGNWDALDAILGWPSAGSWPPSTGIDGGIYKEIQLLKSGTGGGSPIGEVIAWFRPSGTIPLPTGYAFCDGSTILSADNDFGVGDVVLPDLRNAFVLGADAEKSNGTSAAAVGSGTIDESAGAPGPQATGGSNQHTLVTSETPSHDHGGGDHTHTFNRQVKRIPNDGVALPDAPYIINVRDQITNTETTNDAGDIIEVVGGDQAHENRPNWVGLIYICKVKNPTTL